MLPDGGVHPQGAFTRAEVVTILNNIFGGVYNLAGTAYSEDVTGFAIVAAEDVTLQDMTVDGDLILESLRRSLGPSDKDAPPVLITPPQFAKVARYMELQAEKSQLNAEVQRLEAEMQRMKAMIAVDMGKSCKATYDISR